MADIFGNLHSASLRVIFKHAALYGGIVTDKVCLWFVVKEKLMLVQQCIFPFRGGALRAGGLKQLIKIPKADKRARACANKAGT